MRVKANVLVIRAQLNMCMHSMCMELIEKESQYIAKLSLRLPGLGRAHPYITQNSLSFVKVLNYCTSKDCRNIDYEAGEYLDHLPSNTTPSIS